MTNEALAAALRRVATIDDVSGLSALAEQLRRQHAGDPDADVVARHAELKRRRLVQEN